MPGKVFPMRIIRRRILQQATLKRLLALAACGHMALTLALYLIGRFQLMPDVFDTNGIGIMFAADCVGYRTEAVSLIDILMHKGIVAWITAPSEYLVNPFHLKLYSLSFAVCGPLLGYNILSAEPLNLLYYLSTVWLVFALGREAFDRRAGLFAAIIVALWPSFLLHTMQLFRDPLFIAAMLLLMLVCARLLTRNYCWPKNFIIGAIGAATACLLWRLRSEMWEIMFLTILMETFLLLFRQVRERRFLTGNVMSVVLLLAVTVSLPQLGKAIPLWNDSVRQVPGEIAAKAETATPSLRSLKNQTDLSANNTIKLTPPGSRLSSRIGHLRDEFIESYPAASSNIDTDVSFVNLQSVVAYLPRAMAIGLFAPFPNMWLTAGSQVGLKGRALSGLETVLMYLIELAAIMGVWCGRKNLTVWLLLLVAGAGMMALGLVVVNIATLYRMRYVFWMLLIVIGAGGISEFFQSPRSVNKVSYER